MKYFSKYLNWMRNLITQGYRQDHVYQKQVELVYKNSPLLLTAVIMVGTGITWFFHTAENSTNSIIWLLGVYVLSLIRYYFYSQWRSNNSSRSIQYWAKLSIFFSLLSGLQWAATMLIFFNISTAYDVILIAVLLGMISSAAGSLSVIPAAFINFTFPIIIALLVTVISSPEPGTIFYAYLILVFILAFGVFSRNIYRANIVAIKLNIENTKLIKSLEIEKLHAERANHAKTTFLAAASHDLRQPLQSMSLYIEILNDKLRDAENKKLAANISKSHDALRDLLNALLDISKLDAGSVPVAKLRFNLADKLHELENNFRLLSEKKKQQLFISKSVCFIHSDPLIVNRILQNLVSNAIRYAPEEAIIRVETKHQDNVCTITVKDNGHGIPEVDQERIFSEFQQLKNSEKNQDKGLGLGLAIVKKLTDLLGTKIQLRSSVGKGCDFSFNVPLAKDQSVHIQQAIVEKPKFSKLTDINILVVEDEVDVREALVKMLSQWGCDCLQTDNIAGAVSIANEHSIDLILTDYRLKDDETGLHVVDNIQDAGHDVPTVMITGDTAVDKLQEFQEANHIVLHKPVKPAELRAAIQYALN